MFRRLIMDGPHLQYLRGTFLFFFVINALFDAPGALRFGLARNFHPASKPPIYIN